MEDKHVMKNMEYWKKKNNIPGIEGLESAGLTDGRAGSSPFQMADGSPLKSFWKKLGNIATGGVLGAVQSARKGGGWKGAAKSIFTGGVLGSDSKAPGGGAAAGITGGEGGGIEEKVAAKVDEKVDEKVEEAVGGDDGSGLAMKSPVKIYGKSGKRRKNYKY